MKWIVVVDDDYSNLEQAQQILQGQDMQVTCLPSGAALLEFLEENAPDLVLLDEQMPGMDGFETLKRLRERHAEGEQLPVVFLTDDEGQELESKRLQLDAMDAIVKPFTPDVMLSRVRRALNLQERIHRIEVDAATDALTGFLNKAAAEAKMAELCKTESGFLCVLDLDTFKLVNDLYGHDAGDRVLALFAKVLRRDMRFDGACGRIGGDEFILFAKNVSSEDELRQFVDGLNRDFLEGVKEILGSHQVPLGVSAGAALVPEQGRDFARLFHIADQALYTVKQNGKHGCGLWGRRNSDRRENGEMMDLAKITSVLEERYITSNAMWMGKEAFGNIYRYMVRYMQRYHSTAYRVLFTVNVDPALGEIERAEVMTNFRKQMQASLRNSDVMMESSENQLFLLLPEAHEYDIENVINRLLSGWQKTEYAALAKITYEAGRVHLAGDAPPSANP